MQIKGQIRQTTSFSDFSSPRSAVGAGDNCECWRVTINPVSAVIMAFYFKRSKVY